MRVSFAALTGLLALFATSTLVPAHAATAPQPEKDWTFLVYLNGDNNLDSFGALNINQMEQVGSSDRVNVVVQWASTENAKTQRLYVQKDNDPKKVTSPVIQDMGKVDMGDYKSLSDFIKWGAENYPAKHYFVDVWDHGSGWHEIQTLGNRMLSHGHGFDISWDEGSGNHITTAQLGQALAEGAKAIGHKIDLYGSDACLMAMAEVATEMKDSVAYFVGSQETEPGPGWPYDTFLQRLNGQTSPADAAKALAEEYTKSYQGGENGNQEVTFSAYDMSQLDAFNASVANLGKTISKLTDASRKQLAAVISKSQSFTYSDYVDMGDFVKGIQATRIDGVAAGDLAQIQTASSKLIISNHVTQQFAKATGLSIWLPADHYGYDSYAAKYNDMAFAKATQWGDAVKALVQAAGDGSGDGGGGFPN